MKLIRRSNVNTASDIIARGGYATFIDPTGRFMYAPLSYTRLNHKKGTGIFDTALIEPERYNLLLNTVSSSDSMNAFTYVTPRNITGSRTIDLTNKSYKSLDVPSLTSEAIGFVISFYGTGSATVYGQNSYTKTLVGVSDDERVHTVVFNTNGLSFGKVFTIEFSGVVFACNVEPFSWANQGNINSKDYFDFVMPTSFIPTKSSIASRGRDEVDGGIIYNNFSEKYPLYNSNDTYNAGDIVVYKKREYESSVDNNTVKPTGDDSDNSSWLFVGPSNSYAIFDGLIDKSSTQAVTINVIRNGVVILVVTDSNQDASAALGITGKLLNGEDTPVIATLSSYDKNRIGGIKPSVSTNGYFEADKWTAKATSVVTSSAEDANVFCLHLTTTQSKSIINDYYTVDDPDSIVGVTEFYIGRGVEIGETQYRLGLSLIDYSVKEKNQFGFLTYAERGFSFRHTYNVVVNNEDIEDVVNSVVASRGPALWVGTDKDLYRGVSTTYGFIRDFSLIVPHPAFAEYSLEIEGMTL